MIIRHDPPVLNQFLHDGRRGIGACIPICIMAIYHIAEEIRDSNNYNCATLLNTVQWSIIMKRGIYMWTLWKEGNDDKDVIFPKIEEILALTECKEFYNLFKKEEDIDERERSGLAILSKRYENPLGTLYGLFRSMAEKQHDVYAIVILPGHASAVTVVSRRLPRHSFWLFDPHGAAGTDNITLIEFSDYRDLIRYLCVRYDIESIDDYTPIKDVKYSETELYEMYSYSASLFTTLK